MAKEMVLTRERKRAQGRSGKVRRQVTVSEMDRGCWVKDGA